MTNSRTNKARDRRILMSLAAGAAVLVGGCFSEQVSEPENGGGDACTSSATVQCAVEVRDNSFTPATIRVTAGSTVTWRNEGASPHTSTGGTWDSGTISPGATFEQAFAEAGTFSYECLFHAGMSGAVVVE